MCAAQLQVQRARVGLRLKGGEGAGGAAEAGAGDAGGVTGAGGRAVGGGGTGRGAWKGWWTARAGLAADQVRAKQGEV